jgi:DnaK suppressor protein
MVAKNDEEQERLTPEELEEFKMLLLDKRKNLIMQAKETLEAQDTDTKAADEVDQASAEYDLSFEYRLRDREKALLAKIDKVLERIEHGEYDLCEKCGAPIGKKRLQARPETTLCINCKEEEERQEKMFQKKRLLRSTVEF